MSALLKSELHERALALGFARTGVARATALRPEGDRLHAWLRDGKHGTMDWMERTADVRVDPTHEGMLPDALSVVVLVTPYARDPVNEGPVPGRIARYARGRDYHNVLGKRLRKLSKWLRDSGYATRASVDSMPVFERAWAARAGVGFVGKNSCLIVPGLGSHVFLSTLITAAELEPDTPMKERCGQCRLCLDACPTDAFDGERMLDARKCISYLTIETNEHIDSKLMEQTGDWLFGCDVCQDVCPFNGTAPPDESMTEPFAPRSVWGGIGAEAFLEMEEKAFMDLSEGSPLRRPGLSAMARNAAVVLGNRGTRVHLPVLQQAAESHASEVVRRTAAWAVERIENRTTEDR